MNRFYRWLKIHYELLCLKAQLFALNRHKDADVAWLLLVLLTASLLTTASWGYYRGINQFERGMEAGQAQAFEMVRTALLTADQVHPVVLRGTGIELLLWDKGAVIDCRERNAKTKAMKVAAANGH